MKSTRLLLSAGEASGDVLAARVLSGLVEAGFRPSVVGIGGPESRRVVGRTGLRFEELGRVEDLGAAGLVELIPRLPALRRARERLSEALRDFDGPALLVDAPDLHLPIARAARPRGPLGLLVAPQFWAWRPGRTRSIAASVDFVLCLFRFEVEPLRRAGVAAHWVGHPAVDRAAGSRRVPRSSEGPLRVALLPGSRRAEVARLLGPMLAAVEALPGGRPLIEVPWRLAAPAPNHPGVRYTTDSGWDVLGRADLALIGAGTATLEAALLGVPSVCLAAAHPLTAAIGRKLVRVDHLALPNLLLGRPLVPEVVQDLAGPALEAALRTLTEDLPRAAAEAEQGRQELLRLLGPPGFGARAAACLAPFLAPAAA